MFKQTSKHMQHSSWPESGRHLWLFSSRLSKHTLQTLQWNDLSLWILSEKKKVDTASKKYRIHFYHNVKALKKVINQIRSWPKKKKDQQ